MDLNALSSPVEASHKTGISAWTRVASVNATTLLFDSFFYTFILEMHRQFTRDVVARTIDPKKLPKKSTATAWK